MIGDPPPIDTPVLTVLDPSFVDLEAGADAVVLVFGERFLDTAIIVVDSADLATTFISENELSVTVSVAAAFAGVVPVWVRNEGVESNRVDFLFLGPEEPPAEQT
jgi:hypothetical protein